MRPGDILVRNLRLIRRARGFTQEGLALEAIVDRTHVGRIERRIISPTIAKLEPLATTLGVTLKQLLDEDFTLESAGIGPVPIRRKPRSAKNKTDREEEAHKSKRGK
jgi:transcriptional regulator with XRE-family HTH domain